MAPKQAAVVASPALAAVANRGRLLRNSRLTRPRLTEGSRQTPSRSAPMFRACLGLAEMETAPAQCTPLVRSTSRTTSERIWFPHCCLLAEVPLLRLCRWGGLQPDHPPRGIRPVRANSGGKKRGWLPVKLGVPRAGCGSSHTPHERRSGALSLCKLAHQSFQGETFSLEHQPVSHAAGEADSLFRRRVQACSRGRLYRKRPSPHCVWVQWL